MRNPITKTNWFKTPKTSDELIDIAKNMSNAAEAHKMLIFTMNYCHKLVEEEIIHNRFRVIKKEGPRIYDAEAAADDPYGSR